MTPLLKTDLRYIANEFANKIIHARICMSAGVEDTDEEIDYYADRTLNDISDYAQIALETHRRRNKRPKDEQPTDEQIRQIKSMLAEAVIAASRQQLQADILTQTLLHAIDD